MINKGTCNWYMQLFEGLRQGIEHLPALRKQVAAEARHGASAFEMSHFGTPSYIVQSSSIKFNPVEFDFRFLYVLELVILKQQGLHMTFLFAGTGPDCCHWRCAGLRDSCTSGNFTANQGAAAFLFVLGFCLPQLARLICHLQLTVFVLVQMVWQLCGSQDARISVTGGRRTVPAAPAQVRGLLQCEAEDSEAKAKAGTTFLN